MAKLLDELEQHRSKRDHLAVVIARLAADGHPVPPSTLNEFTIADAAYVRTLDALVAENGEGHS